MSWRDTIQDETPDAGTDAGPLKVTVPTAENLENAVNKKSWRDTVQDDPDAGNPFVENFKQGASDAGSLIANSARFLTGNELPEEPTPMQNVLRQKHAAGTADRHDYERAFLEGMGNSPGGKLMGAIGGLLPSANVATTTINKWINPYISDKTGIDPSELALGEMAAAPAGAKVLKAKAPDLAASDLPEVKAAGMIGKAAGPIVGTAVKAGANALGTVGRPVIHGIMDMDNPLTGEPGLKTAFASPEAAEGARLENNIPGLKLSAGEMTGNPTARGIEDTLANSAKWGGTFAEANENKVNAIVNHFNGVLSNIYGKETVPEDFGRGLSTAYRGTLDSLAQTRREQAKIDFGEAYENSDDAGKYIPSNNLFKTLQDLKDEGDARLLTKSKALGGKMGKSLLSKLAVTTQKGNEMADNITIKELGNGLSDFGEDAANPEHTDAERRVYTRIYGALQKDLDAEIAKPHGDPQRVAMLAQARDNYNTFSSKMSDLQKTTLGNLIGYADHDSQGNIIYSPETIANKFNTLQPSELRSTLKFLDDNHPDVANMGRRYMLESVLRKAQDGVGLRGVGTTKPFAKADFVKNLPSPEKLDVLLSDPRAHSDIMDVAAATNRLIDWGAEQRGSQTAQRTDFFRSLYGLGKGAFIKSVVSDNLAQDLLDPTKRHQMGVQARQTQRMFDTLKTKGAEFWKDQSGSMNIDFKSAKERLEQIKRANPDNDNVVGGTVSHEMSALQQAFNTDYKGKEINEMTPRQFQAWIDDKNIQLGKIPQDLLEHLDSLDQLGHDTSRQALKSLATEQLYGNNWAKAWNLSKSEAKPINDYFMNNGIEFGGRLSHDEFIRKAGESLDSEE